MSKLVVIVAQTIVIQLIFVQAALVVEPYFVVGSQFVQWDHVFLHSLNFSISLNCAFGWCHKETVRHLFQFSQFDVFWLLQRLPVFGMLNFHFAWHISDIVQWRNSLTIQRVKTTLSLLEIDEFEPISSIVAQFEA